MQKLRIMSVVGARPNFMKIAPFTHAIEAHNKVVSTSNFKPQTSNPQVLIEHFLVHTGQHYDKAMSESFFQALDIPRPDVDLGIGSGSHAEQVGKTMMAFEKVLLDWKPDWVVVVGDVNATCACSITAKKHHVKVAHIEAGLRSFDERMPEEINRLVTDSISDLLFTPDRFANENLRREGHPEGKIKFVGNVMIDTLEAHREQAVELDLNEIIQRNLIPSEDRGRRTTEDGGKLPHQPSAINQQLAKGAFCVLTMHRPSNVDNKAVLEALVECFIEHVSKDMPLVWSLHPRTRKQLESFGLWSRVAAAKNIIPIHPVGYHEMMKLNLSAKVMLTDSGGLQEESCVLGTPCITMRENTERPVTLMEHGGMSELAGSSPEKIIKYFDRMMAMTGIPHAPELWDGHAAERIVACFI